MQYVEFITGIDGLGNRTTHSFPLDILTEILCQQNSVILFFNSVTATQTGEIDKNKNYYGTRIVLTKSGQGTVIFNGLLNELSRAFGKDAQFPTVINLTQLTDSISVEDIVGSCFPVGYYGSFYDTTDQLNAGVTAANAMRYNSVETSNGVSVVSNTRLTIANQGIYNIQFSAQVTKTDSGTDFVDIWLSKNGTNVPNTNTTVYLPGNDARVVAAWNFVTGASAGDYFELYWASADTDVLLLYQGPTGSPTRPAVPSVIATVSWVGFAT